MIARVALPLAALVCSGCMGSALDSRREAPQVFRLEAPALPDSGAALPIALAVARPRAPMSLDSERIAVTGAAHGFDYYAGVRWVEPAPLMLQQLIVEALVADGRFSTVVASPSRVPAEYLLDVELRTFEARGSGTGAPVASVRMQATLLDTRHGTRLASFVADAEQAAAADRRDAVIAAFDAATRQAVEAIVAGVRRGSEAAPR